MSINAVDFVTRLVITEGEEVVALYGRVTNQKVMIPVEGKKKKEPYFAEYDPFISQLDLSTDCGVFVYRGVYDGCLRIKGVEADWEQRYGHMAFMRKSTFDYIVDTYNNREIPKSWKEAEDCDKRNDMLKGREKADELKGLDDRLAGIYTKYGLKACRWAINQTVYAMTPTETDNRKVIGAIVDANLFSFNKWRFDKESLKAQRKGKRFFFVSKIDYGSFERYASDYHEVLEPISWFTCVNNIKIDPMFGFAQHALNYDCVRNLCEFVVKETKRLPKKQQED